MPIVTNFTRDVKQYIAEAEADIKNTVLIGGPHDPMSLALAGLIGMQRALVEGDLIKLVQDNILDWDQMDCDTLYRRGAEIGIPLRGSGPARGSAEISGVAGTSIPNTLKIVSGGIEYGIDIYRPFPSVISLTGTAVLPIVALDTGALGNQNQPGTGVLSTNIPLIQTFVPSVVATGGYDMETCEEYRARVKAIDRLDNTPASRGWHMRRAYRYPGITRVCFDTCNCCEGQIGMFIFANGRFSLGIPDADFVAEVQAAVFDTPIGSTTYGSKLLGRTGLVSAAIAKEIKVRVTGTYGMLPDSRKRAQDEIASFFEGLCPSQTICKSSILSIVSSHGSCPSNVAFEFSDGFTDDGVNLIPDCSVLPILTEVCLA